MAELYLAMITGTAGFEKLLAIKKILPLLAREADLVNSFIEEAKLAALLHHQNVVQIYDFGCLEGAYFIAMEYLSGKNSMVVNRQALAHGQPLPAEFALFICSRVCAGLSYAHKKKDLQGKPLNLVHRDISPQNIFITYEGEVKIVDFGIAKAANQSTITQMGMIKGKFAYMSPEQAGAAKVDQRSDIFSSGILLYELVTGKKMFTGDAMEVLGNVRDGKYTIEQPKESDVPPAIFDIIRRAMQKLPDDRYQSCAEMMADIERCMADNNMRPTAQGLAEYVQNLFAEEIVREDEKMLQRLETVSVTLADQEQEPSPADIPAPSGIGNGQHAVEREDSAAAAAEPAHAEAGATAAESGTFDSGAGQLDEGEIGEAARVSQGFAAKKTLFAAAAGVAFLVIIVMMFLGGESGDEKGAAEQTSSAEKIEMTVAPESTRTLEKPAAATEKEDPQKIADQLYVKALQEQALPLVKSQPEEALKFLLEALAADKKNVVTNTGLGQIYMNARQYPQAIEAYQRVLEVDRLSPDILFNLGLIYAAQADFEKAEKVFKKVVVIQPDYIDEAFFNLAMIQEKLGKREESIKNVKKALLANPENEMAASYLEKIHTTGER